MEFQLRKRALLAAQAELLGQKNTPLAYENGVLRRFEHPVLTSAHVPLSWRYDFSETDNPFFQERMAVGAVFNSGAILHEGRYLLMARVEGCDRKSFFAIAESPNGVDNFQFWDEPVELPEAETPETNVYDARLTAHEDGYIYAIFCAERKDPDAPLADTSRAVAAAGIARTTNLRSWERLPDLITPSPQQRNVVLHPRRFQGKYLFYTRPQDGFIDTGSGGGIAWGVSDSMEHAVIERETLLDPRIYHTVKEVKNGAGAPPIETEEGWIHIAHAVRNTAAGLRYVLYAFMCDKDNPTRILHAPAGYFLAPSGVERVGDVSNVVFSNGIVQEPSGRVLIYFGSSDTRLHVAESSIERLLDYVKHTPEDPLTSAKSVLQRLGLIRKNGKIA